MEYTSKLYALRPQESTEKHYLKLQLAISSSQLVDIIYSVYGKRKIDSVKSHLLLICGPSTSETMLQVMFKRAKKFTNIYMIIGINHLSFKLQEVNIIAISGFREC